MTPRELTQEEGLLIQRSVDEFSIGTTTAPVAVHTDRFPRYAGQNGIEEKTFDRRELFIALRF